MEEEEHVPFLARILTVAQNLAVVLVLGHSEVPLLFGASLTVRILVGMALGVLIVTVVAYVSASNEHAKNCALR